MSSPLSARRGPIRVQDWLLCAHTLVMGLVLLSTYRALQSQQWSGMYLQGQLLYGAIIYFLILRLRSPNDLLYPSGVFILYTYLAYFVKGVVYLFDQELYLRNWITLNSPLAHSTFRDWAVAMMAAAIGVLLFCLGYWFVDRSVPAKKQVPAMRRLNGARMTTVLLAWGAVMVVLRVFVTWYLGVGASTEASGRVFLVPGLSGFLSLFSMWGGRFVVAAAFAVAATSRSGVAMLAAGCEMLALGGMSTIATGSKSELLLALVILMATAYALRHSLPRHVYATSATVSVALLVAIVVVYPAFHEYRYLRHEMDIGTYLQRYQSEMGLADGGKDVLRRLNGLEYLTMVVTYYELNGYRPEMRLNYQPFILKQLFGVPDHVTIGLGIGPFGGLLLIGGWTMFPLLCALGGMGVRLSEYVIDKLIATAELRVAALATFSIWMSIWLMFNGSIPFMLKELIAMLFALIITHVLCTSPRPGRALRAARMAG